MLGETSVSMMVLLVIVAASLIGIASIHQYIEGQAPPPAATPKLQQLSAAGTIILVKNFDSSAGKACAATLQLAQRPNSNNLGIKPGTFIALLAPNESFCTLFGLAEMGRLEIDIQAQNIKSTSLPPAIQTDLIIPASSAHLYKISKLVM
jgi:hypothetical protein